MKNDLRNSHFTLGNFSYKLQSTNQSDFNNANNSKYLQKDLAGDLKTLRSHNHKLGSDRIEYLSETHNRFSKPQSNDNPISRQLISTAALQQSHYKFGNDPSSFSTTTHTSYNPKSLSVKYLTKDLTKTNFVLGSDRPGLQTSNNESYIKHEVKGVTQENKFLSNDLRKHHYTLGNDNIPMNSLSRQDYAPMKRGSSYDSTLDNNLLRQSNIKLGASNQLSDETTYNQSMKPYPDFKKQTMLENNNYKSSVPIGSKLSTDDKYATEFRTNFGKKASTWNDQEKEKVKKIMNNIKKHNCEYGIDKPSFNTTNSDTYQYNLDKALKGRGFLEQELSKDLRNSHYKIGYDNNFEKQSTHQATYIPKYLNPSDKAAVSAELRMSHFDLQGTNLKGIGKTTYTTDYTKKEIVEV